MKANHSTAVREAKSREEIKNMFLESDFGMYSEIFDRKNFDGTWQSIDRYLDREDTSMPSADWCRKFVISGGSFDSCGSWGITPKRGIELEYLNIPAHFAGSMLALLGRADYDYYHGVVDVYNEGMVPKTRAEFHTLVAGINRQKIAQEAKAKPKSTVRLGWMKEDEFTRYLLKTSTRIISNSTRYNHFNGVYFYEENENFLTKSEFLRNPVFAKWVSKRPSESVRKERQLAKSYVSPVGWLKKVPPYLMAAAMRKNKEYFNSTSLDMSRTSVGRIFDTGDGEILIHCPDNSKKTAKTIFGRKIKWNLFSVKIGDKCFIWNPSNGFQNHIEANSFREAFNMWENRSRKGEPRPLCFNDIRNDRTGTSGFCLTGTKSFLQNRMPFVYRLVSKYSSWSEIPNEIMSTVWDVDFKVFKGYPVP